MILRLLITVVSLCSGSYALNALMCPDIGFKYITNFIWNPVPFRIIWY